MKAADKTKQREFWGKRTEAISGKIWKVFICLKSMHSFWIIRERGWNSWSVHVFVLSGALTLLEGHLSKRTCTTYYLQTFSSGTRAGKLRRNNKLGLIRKITVKIMTAYFNVKQGSAEKPRATHCNTERVQLPQLHVTHTTCIWRLRWRWPRLSFAEIFGSRKLESTRNDSRQVVHTQVLQ